MPYIQDQPGLRRTNKGPRGTNQDPRNTNQGHLGRIWARRTKQDPGMDRAPRNVSMS